MILTTAARELIDLQNPIRRSKRIRVSRRFRQRIYWRDNGRCVFCDVPVPFEKATLDHITPLIRSGRTRSKENVAISCLKCNNKKGPLELETLDDLAPQNLWVKFQKVTEAAQNRKGHYPEWVAALVQ